MASPTTITTGARPMRDPAPGLTDRLVKTGLIGAGALTLTWWTLIACGLWQAIEWVYA